MTTYSGSCHCGEVTFDVMNDLTAPVRCNCSFCRRRGAMLHRVMTEEFCLKKGEDRVRAYGNRDFSKHFFCSTCGIHVFTRVDREGRKSVMVNLNCIEGLEIDALTPTHFDGARLI
ncbi:MAG: GFA family protein [Flavobacteriaceae bacterium]